LKKNHEFSLDTSEKVNFSRPSLDVTFESAAEVYGNTLVGVILSGANADGSNGLKAIKQKGGLIIAQKPETAQVAYMPQQAILNNTIDFIFNVNELATFINSHQNR
jgi:two-component system chemotaxis response regulator CheB